MNPFIALLIPVAISVVAATLFKREIVWWEMALSIVISGVFILIVAALFRMGMTKEMSYQIEKVYSVTHYEDWDEYIHKTCTRQVPSGTDSKGNTTYRTETYDCSYVDYHPAYTAISTKTGRMTVSHQSLQYYQGVSKIFGNSTFKDMNRYYHSDDGDAYTSKSDLSFEKGIRVAVPYWYSNNLRYSSVLSYPKVDEIKADSLELYKQPKITYGYQVSLAPKQRAVLNDSLQYLLSSTTNKISIVILPFFNEEESISYHQEYYWYGGLDNQITICVGIGSDGKPTWLRGFYHNHSALVNSFLIHYRNKVASQAYESLTSLTADLMNGQKYKELDRADLEKDYGYLSVSFPIRYIIAIFTIALMISVVTNFLFASNNVVNTNVRR